MLTNLIVCINDSFSKAVQIIEKDTDILVWAFIKKDFEKAENTWRGLEVWFPKITGANEFVDFADW